MPSSLISPNKDSSYRMANMLSSSHGPLLLLHRHQLPVQARRRHNDGLRGNILSNRRPTLLPLVLLHLRRRIRTTLHRIPSRPFLST